MSNCVARPGGGGLGCDCKACGVNDEGIYRPLFVMVEAVEAEIKRKLTAQALAPLMSGPTLEDHQRCLRLVLKNDSVCVQRATWDTVVIVSHHCQICQEFHRTKVNEIAPSRQIFIDRLVRETKALLEKPCNIELRTP